jgi:branched-chain amino acid transport system ATP-binding protein/branched-chain amino acid transport system permease protein
MKLAELRQASPRAGWILGVLVLVVIVPAAAERLPDYWLTLCLAGVQTALILLSIGLLTDRAGMLAVAPMSFAGVGAWAMGFFNLHQWPGGFLVWLILSGIVTIPFGLLVGVPALRLRGINLVVITLSFATAVSSVLNAWNFPGTFNADFIARPGLFETDNAYFTLCWIAFVIGAVAVWGLGRLPFGTAWRAVARSERATAAMGISVARTKLGAFILSSFMAGVAGALIVGQIGTGTPDSFTPLTSLSMVAIAIMVGAGYPEGAIVGGVFSAFSPEVLGLIHLPQDFGNIFFAVGAISVLKVGTSMSGGWRASARKRLKRKGRRTAAAASGGTHAEVTSPAVPAPAAGPLLAAVAQAAPAAAAAAAIAQAPGADPPAPVLRAHGLTVRFGNVVALDSVDLEVPERSVYGLIGPNGAGKSTLIDAVTGFLRHYEGSIEIDQVPIDSLPVHLRVRAGVRRTFQTERTVPQLTVREYVRLAARGSISREEIAELLEFLDAPSPDLPIAEVDVGARRLVELAGAVAGKPRIVLLDEPAAGLGQRESARLATRISELPARFGCAVLLIEHDMDVVAAACSQITVLDFGKEIAKGAPGEVLEMGTVVTAYLGEQSVVADGDRY